MKEIPIDRLYTTRFGELEKLTESKVFQAIKEMYKDIDIKPENSLYYQLMDRHIKHVGHAFGWVRDEEQKIIRIDQLKELIKSIRDNGYKEELEGFYEDGGVRYGDISVERLGKDFSVVDGHHRICIMILMGDKFIKARINGRS